MSSATLPTELRIAPANGARAASETLLLVYGELKQIARKYLRGETASHTLQPTALLHEAYLKMCESRNLEDLTTSEFCAALSNIMRRILVDHARRKQAEKRGGKWVRVNLETSQLPAAQLPMHDLLDLDQALDLLETHNERHANVVKLRFFAGLTVEETAGLLGVSETTVKNDWRVARAWLLARLRMKQSASTER